MKVEIPNQLKSEIPQSTWGKILTATPVVMAVVATMLAGLSSSEMTRAQYDRSYAAQMQSKAADQWGYFQAKRLRGAMQRSTLDMISSTAEVRPFDTARLKEAVAGTSAGNAIEAPDVQNLVGLLQASKLPALPAAQKEDSALYAAMDAVANGKPEADIETLLVPINAGAIDEALRRAMDRAAQFDSIIKPHTLALDHLDAAMAGLPGAAPIKRDVAAARLRFSEMRYDAEARLNATIGNLYELKVRKNNMSAERHHRRSQRFFYGMLAAQMAVIVSTFAIAARQRNVLWSLAAAAGIIAVAIAVYVYICV